MADYLAIGDAVAARFAPGVVTPPAGQPNIRLSTARPPNAIPTSPFVVVLILGTEDTWSSGILYGQAQLRVRFHRAKHEADVPREWSALEAWLGVLRGQIFGQWKVGQAPVVSKVLIARWTINLLTYAGIEYDGIEGEGTIWTEEPVAATP